MRRALSATCVCAVLAASACAQTPTIEGKKIVGGHGYAMPSTYTLRQDIGQMQNVPLDGIMVNVNRNDMAGKP